MGIGQKIEQAIRNVIQEIGALKKTGRSEILGIVEELRRGTVLALAHEDVLTPSIADSLKARIAELITRFDEKILSTMNQFQRRSFVRGIQLVDKAIASGDVRVAVPYLSEQTLEQLRTYNASLIKGISDLAREKISQEITLGVLGQKPATDIIKAMGKNLDSPSIFGTVKKRAETIYRTEIDRAHNLASQKRIKQIAPQLGDLMKEWRHGYVGIPRPGHLVMHGVRVDATEKFVLKSNGKTYRVDGPHDTSLPPEETINCRCVAIPVLKRFDHLRN